MSTLENKTAEAQTVVISPETSSEVQVVQNVCVRINAETAEAVDAFYSVLQATYSQIHIRTNSPLNHVSHPDSSTAVDVTIKNGQWAAISQLAMESKVTIEPWPSDEEDQDLIDS